MPELRNAEVTTAGPDGINTQRIYGADGNIVTTATYSGVQSFVDGKLASSRSLRWRWLVPATAVALGFVAVLLTRHLAQRSSA